MSGSVAKISIIIPTLDEAAVIGGTLASLSKLRGEFQVIVVDGGSSDDTRSIAEAFLESLPDSRFVSHRRGRGPQMNRGALEACGDVFLFLHADTLLPADALESIREAARDPSVVGGNFRLVCGGSGLSSSIFTRLNAIRRWFGVYYGDSAIWVRRSVYDGLRGFMDAPIMEDYDFCRRLERAGPTVCLPSPVVTSPRRWTRGRAIMAVFIWTLIQWLYLLGVSPRLLGRLYYPRVRFVSGGSKQSSDR